MHSWNGVTTRALLSNEHTGLITHRFLGAQRKTAISSPFWRWLCLIKRPTIRISLEVTAERKRNVNPIWQTERVWKEETGWTRVSYKLRRCHVWMGISHQLCYLTHRKTTGCGSFHQMWRRACMPAWSGWKLNVKPGRISSSFSPHQESPYRISLTWREFSAVSSQLPVPVWMKYPSGGAGSAPLLTPGSTLKLFLWAVLITLWRFAVLGCFNRPETAQQPSYKKAYLIYTALEFLQIFTRFHFFVIWSSFKVGTTKKRIFLNCFLN